MAEIDHSVSNKKRSALLNILNRLPAQLVYYASALGAVALVGGVNVPPELSILAGGIGVNILSRMIERIANDDNVTDEELRQEIEKAIQRSDVRNLLTKQDFLSGYGRLINRLDILRAALKNGDIEVVRILTEYLAKNRETFVELNKYISTIIVEQGNSAQRDETIIALLKELHESIDRINLTASITARTNDHASTFQFSQPTRVDTMRLHELIVHHFDYQGLELLVFDVEQAMMKDGYVKKFTLEMIEDGALPNVVLKLIQFMEQRGSLDYLIQAVRRARPMIELL